MSIETDLFSNYQTDPKALLDYGFAPEGDVLVLRRALPEDGLEIIVEYDTSLHGRILDLAAGGEYTNFRMETSVGYSAGIRGVFTDLLLDIREKCARDMHFSSPQARRICALIAERLGGKPEFLWRKFPSFAAFRLKTNGKWYALMGGVPRYKIDPSSGEASLAEVVNFKADSTEVSRLIMQKGYFPAYHMNKKSWVSVILDDTVPDEEIMDHIAASYKVVS